MEKQKRAKESTKRKLEASEEKCIWSISAPEVMTSLEASSLEASQQKQDHQKLKFIRRWKILKIQELGIWFDHVLALQKTERV